MAAVNAINRNVKIHRGYQQRLLDSFLILFMVAMSVYFAFASRYFLSIKNFMNIFSSVSIVGIIATGMTLIIITRGIDLSVGAIIALSGCICALLIEKAHLHWSLAMLAALAAGLAIGMFNGFLISVHQHQRTGHLHLQLPGILPWSRQSIRPHSGTGNNHDTLLPGSMACQQIYGLWPLCFRHRR
ncbi:MAG: ribose transport system permease protein [Spirochaetes bacterium]|nr:MAG: ribose transport system permease protein [Spirochaetota bacterium]